MNDENEDLKLSSAENWTEPRFVKNQSTHVDLYPTTRAGVRRWRELVAFGEKKDIDLDFPPRIEYQRWGNEAMSYCEETEVLKQVQRKLQHELNEPSTPPQRRAQVEVGLVEIEARLMTIAKLMAQADARLAPRQPEQAGFRAMPELSDSAKAAQLQLAMEDLALELLTMPEAADIKAGLERYHQLHRERVKLAALNELQANAERARLRRQQAPIGAPSDGASMHRNAEASGTRPHTPPSASAPSEGKPEASLSETRDDKAEPQTAQRASVGAEGRSVDTVDSGGHQEGTGTPAESAGPLVAPVEVKKDA